MRNPFRKSRKEGLPPGSLVHIGDKKTEQVGIQILDYDEKAARERVVKDVEECQAFRLTPTVTWINVNGLHQTNILESIGKQFDIHPLTLEDILNTTQRPKIEDFEKYVYIVLKMIYLNPKDSELESEQISLILGENFVITFQEREGDVFDPVRQRIKDGMGRVRKMKSDYLAYALMDAVVDNYFSVLEHFDAKIDHLEEAVFQDPNPELMGEIHTTRREVIFLRKAVWPLREMISLLERRESKLFKKQTMLYMRDLYDHTIQLVETVDTFREMISGMHDLYLSTVSNRMNEVMKILTIIATIFIPMTFVAGVYGMNFDLMPELHWKFGYPAALLVMLVIGLVMLLYFKKKKWL